MVPFYSALRLTGLQCQNSIPFKPPTRPFKWNRFQFKLVELTVLIGERSCGVALETPLRYAFIILQLPSWSSRAGSLTQRAQKRDTGNANVVSKQAHHSLRSCSAITLGGFRTVSLGSHCKHLCSIRISFSIHFFFKCTWSHYLLNFDSTVNMATWDHTQHYQGSKQGHVSIYNFMFKLLCGGSRRMLKQMIGGRRLKSSLWSNGCCFSAEGYVDAETGVVGLWHECLFVFVIPAWGQLWQLWNHTRFQYGPFKTEVALKKIRPVFDLKAHMKVALIWFEKIGFCVICAVHTVI